MSKVSKLVTKFVQGFPVCGIYLHKSGRIIPLEEKDPQGLLVLRKHISELKKGILDLLLDNTEFTAAIEPITEGVEIALVAEAKSFQMVANHWKRQKKFIIKSIPTQRIVADESLETRILKVIEDIDEHFSITKNQLITLGEKVNSRR